MPDTRRADYHLSYALGSVFLDFDTIDDSIRLVRISFDGYGCHDLSSDPIAPLSRTDADEFRDMFDTGIIDQFRMTQIIRKTIQENKKHLWTGALIEYNLLSKSYGLNPNF
jgi:hypothetical protein